MSSKTKSSSPKRRSARLQASNNSDDVAPSKNNENKENTPTKSMPKSSRDDKNKKTSKSLKRHTTITLTSSSNNKKSVIASGTTRSMDTSTTMDTRRVTFARETRSSAASRRNNNKGGSKKARPHQKEASKALDALRIQAEQQKKGVAAVQSINQKDSKETAISFPTMLHAMIEELNESAPDVVEWTKNGVAFCIHKPKSPVLIEAMKKYFKHGTYTSLKRQLNMYGWKKHDIGEFKGMFHNELFHRDPSKADMDSIKRRQEGDGLVVKQQSESIVAVTHYAVPARRNESTRMAHPHVPIAFSTEDTVSSKSTLKAPAADTYTSSVATLEPVPVSRDIANDKQESAIIVLEKAKSFPPDQELQLTMPSQPSNLPAFAAHGSLSDSQIDSKPERKSQTAQEYGLKGPAMDSSVVTMSPTRSFFSFPASASPSPVDFDGLSVSSFTLSPSTEQALMSSFSLSSPMVEKRDFHVGDQEPCVKRIRLTLYDGRESLKTSPIDAIAAFTSSHPMAITELANVCGPNMRLPRETPAEQRMPPPSRDASLSPLPLARSSSFKDFLIHRTTPTSCWRLSNKPCFQPVDSGALGNTFLCCSTHLSH